MASSYASWVHGTSVQMEREGYHISKERRGYGAIFRSHGNEYFHFSIPTPVLIENQNVSLKKLYLFYKTEGTAKITYVSAYDGRVSIAKFDNLLLGGDHSSEVDEKNSLLIRPTPIKMNFGLGISLLVEFGGRNKKSVPAIHFVSAGADFII